jgi:hypothetical protein
MKPIDPFLDFLLFERGEAVELNGSRVTALIIDASQSAEYYDDQYIRTKTELHTGDVVAARGFAWLIISQVEASSQSYRGRMRQSNHNTKFILDGWLYEYPSIIEMVNLTLDEGREINLLAGRLDCTLQSNDLTRSISENTRFIASDAAWKIVGVDQTKTGLLILNAERDSLSAGDDMQNEIANADSIPVWTIGLAAAVETVSLNETVTAIAVLYRDGTEYAGEEFLWQSSDDTIASVQGGVITGVALGSADITAAWVKHPSINYSFSVLVEEEAEPVITYRFYSSYLDGSEKSYSDFDILEQDTKKYGIEKYIDGTLASENDTYTFSLDRNGVPTANYTYTVLDSRSVSIENKDEYLNAYMTLTGISDQTSEELSVQILLRGVW